VTVLDGCIEELVSFMDRKQGIALAGPRILNPDGTMQPTCMRLPTYWNSISQALALDKLLPNLQFFGGTYLNIEEHRSAGQVEALKGCFWIIRRKAMDQVGLLDERFFIFGEDLDWCKRFRQRGWQVVYYQGTEAVHHSEASSAKSPVRFYVELYKARLRYWQKHHGNAAVRCVWVIMLLHHAARIVAGELLYLTSPSKREVTAHKIRRSIACIKWLLDNGLSLGHHGDD
jgi:GT2 family glycosyltransferase